MSYRVGIHSGVIYYGSVGCEAHADYTVCGDVANVASRVKALADTYGLPTVVSGNVADKVAPGFSCVLLDVVCLKGHRVTLTRLYHLAESDSPEVGKHAAERFGRIHNDMQIGLDSEATELVWRTLRDKRFVKYKKVLCILLNRLQRKGVGENRDVIPVRLDRRKRGKNGQVPCGTRKTFAHSNNTASQKLNKQSV